MAVAAATMRRCARALQLRRRLRRRSRQAAARRPGALRGNNTNHHNLVVVTLVKCLGALRGSHTCEVPQFFRCKRCILRGAPWLLLLGKRW